MLNLEFFQSYIVILYMSFYVWLSIPGNNNLPKKKLPLEQSFTHLTWVTSSLVINIISPLLHDLWI